MDGSERKPYYVANLIRDGRSDVLHIEGPAVDIRVLVTPTDRASIEFRSRTSVAEYLGIAPDSFDLELITDSWPDELPPAPASAPPTSP